MRQLPQTQRDVSEHPEPKHIQLIALSVKENQNQNLGDRLRTAEVSLRI